MAIITEIEGMYFFEMRGKLGISTGLGRYCVGLNRLGDPKLKQGILRLNKRHRSNATVLMKTYRPTNPKSEQQQANRAVFAQGVAGWHELTAEEKLNYRRIGAKQNRNGFQIYMKEYMRANL